MGVFGKIKDLIKEDIKAQLAYGVLLDPYCKLLDFYGKKKKVIRHIALETYQQKQQMFKCLWLLSKVSPKYFSPAEKEDYLVELEYWQDIYPHNNISDNLTMEVYMYKQLMITVDTLSIEYEEFHRKFLKCAEKTNKDVRHDLLLCPSCFLNFDKFAEKVKNPLIAPQSGGNNEQ